MKPSLRVYRDERGRELLDLPDMPLPDADTPAPVRFLPEYDNLLLSHQNRTRVIPDKYHAHVFLTGLRVRATILVDGFVAGGWKIEKTKDTATLVIEPFEPLTKPIRDALAEEGRAAGSVRGGECESVSKFDLRTQMNADERMIQKESGEIRVDPCPVTLSDNRRNAMKLWQSGDIEVNKLKLHYTRTGGDKPPVVLAHGFSDDGLCWTPVAKLLEADYDVVMVDARGHGKSDMPKRGAGRGGLAGDLAGVITGLGLKQPAVLGHSMGAVTALGLAGTYPDLPGAILLEDPPPWWMPAPLVDARPALTFRLLISSARPAKS